SWNSHTPPASNFIQFDCRQTDCNQRLLQSNYSWPNNDPDYFRKYQKIYIIDQNTANVFRLHWNRGVLKQYLNMPFQIVDKSAFDAQNERLFLYSAARGEIWAKSAKSNYAWYLVLSNLGSHIQDIVYEA